MDSGIVAEFENRLLDIYEHAQKAFDAVFELPKLSFERMGLKAGVAYFLRNEIKINPDYFAANLRDMLYRTLPHEAAHLIAFKLYGDNGHGAGWKKVMRRLGLTPERCHSYDTSAAQLRRTSKYLYSCPKCQTEFEVGATIHKRSSLGETKYYCKCKSEIVFVRKMD